MFRRFILIVISTLFYFILSPTPTFAWDNLNGGDHSGLDWTPSNGSEIAGIQVNIGDFNINSGNIVYVAPASSAYGSVEIRARNIYISGSLDGIGRGGSKTSTSNPVGSAWGGGGGGYGGAGGGGFGGSACNATGGVSYGTIDNFDIDQGSDGGKGSSGGVVGGKGGAKIILIASQTITILGSIENNGTMSGNGYGGGGSGGGIYLQAPQIIQSGTIEAKGGDSDGNGGGGAGGRIKYFYNSLSETGSESVAGGQKWPGEWTCRGEDGTVTKVPDYTAPDAFHTISGTLGNNSWYTTTVNVALAAEDLESGVKSIEYWIDGGIHQTIPYSTGRNLIDNPSFENNDGLGGINSWSKVIGGVATFSQTNDAVKFGSFAVKILSSASGWNSFDTNALQAPYLIAGKAYTVSGWVKRDNLSGNGAQIRVLSTDGTLIASTISLAGTGDWVRVSKSFSPSVSGIYLVEVGLEGGGTVWWDGANLYEGIDEPSFNFVVSLNGQHQVHYLATNNENLKSSVKDSEVFKIDTISPANWRNFTLTRPPGANDHTLIASITVDDTTSGLDPASAYFQYIVRSYPTFGYYSNLESCSSTWIPNDASRSPNIDGPYDLQSGWKPATVNPNTPGANTVTITTPRIDFCDDEWADLKKIRFMIKDMAGNTSTREFAINAPWLQTSGGDVHSEVGINMQTSSGNNASFVVSAPVITNFISSNNWLVSPYSGLAFLDYSYWSNKMNPSKNLVGGKLPQTAGSGTYLVNSDYIIDQNTHPSSSASFTAVVFINGDLYINNDFSVNANSAIVFVVKKDVKVRKQVRNMVGVYFADGKINTSYNGSGEDQLTVKGSMAAKAGFDLNRGSTEENGSTSSEFIQYQPTYLMNSDLAKLFSTSNYIWQEVVP
ncbi:MAG: hypothetical protein M1150_00915 [Patescibacteria group bacterium]|nr:hypothetical protein [Patescibacteria group bacterium]